MILDAADGEPRAITILPNGKQLSLLNSQSNADIQPPLEHTDHSLPLAIEENPKSPAISDDQTNAVVLYDGNRTKLLQRKAKAEMASLLTRQEMAVERQREVCMF